MNLVELCKKIFEDSLEDGGLRWTDESTGEIGVLSIKQICIDDIDDKNIDDPERESSWYPVVLFNEGTSDPIDTVAGNPSDPGLSQVFRTPIQIFVFSDERDEAVMLAQAVQHVVYRGLCDMAHDWETFLIDGVTRGAKSISKGIFENQSEQGWQAFRSIIVTNRIEP